MWALNRIGLLGQVRRSEYLRNKAESISHIASTLEVLDESMANQVRETIVRELTSLLEELRRDEQKLTPKSTLPIREFSLTRKIFLLYKPTSVVAWLVHALYYYLLLGSIFVPFIYYVVLDNRVSFSIVGSLISMIINMLVVYIVYLWAMRIRNRNAMGGLDSRLD